jgi:hypothetical protein
MTDGPTPYGHQDFDSLITDADLPDRWYLPRRFPGERPDDHSADIDALLGYDDSTTTDEQHQAQRASERPETIDGRWRYIEHTPTGTRVHIRLQEQTWANPPEVRITGVIHLPRIPGDPITGQQLREVPIARIEVNINRRLFSSQAAVTLSGSARRIELRSGRKINRRDLLSPVTPGPKANDDFYQLIALQYEELTLRGNPNPAAEVATINAVPLSTAQGWLTKARTLGLLPPGRRGRIG